jgi:hypothetical protein
MSDRKRPIGVTIVGCLFFLAGLFFIAAGGIGLGNEDSIVMAASGVSLIIGIFYILLSFGCFKGWGWVWTLAVLFTILGILVTLWGAFSNGFDMDALWAGLIGIIIPLIILLYLFSHKVKVWFGKA